MNTRSMTDSERRSFYAALIAKQRSSSLSIPDFCKRNHISAWTFYQWRKQLSTSQRYKPSVTAFLPLPVAQLPEAKNNACSSAEIILDRGIRLRVPADYPPQSVKALLGVLLEK